MSTATDLAALTERVDALEQLARSSPDSLQPNVLTINPDGTIGANFSGHISAQGIDFPAAAATPTPPPSVLDWLDSQARQIARVYAGLVSNDLELQALAVGPNAGSAVVMAALDALGNTNSASLSVARGQPGAPSSVVAGVINAGQVTILDSNGNSSFVRLAVPNTELVIAVGSANVTFNNTAQASTTVATGLPAGFTRWYPFVTMAGTAGQYLHWSYGGTVANTTFNATGGGTLTGTFGFVWAVLAQP